MESEKDKVLQRLVEASERPLDGWDFSHLHGRMLEEKPTWDFQDLVRDMLPGIRGLLDIGTGGGGILSAFEPLPPVTCATEAYRPNVQVARSRLVPLGVPVLETDQSGTLPFRDDSFDLVISRHSSYHPSEILRVLCPGGRFATQQVGSLNNIHLNRLLGSSRADVQIPAWDLAVACAELTNVRFQIERADEDHPRTRFLDTGAVVSYLTAIPWQVPDFSVRRYACQLLALHHRFERDGHLDCRSHRFLVIARKPITKSPTP